MNPRILMVGPKATSGGVAMHTKQIISALKKYNLDILEYNSSFSCGVSLFDNIIKIYKRTLGLSVYALAKHASYDIIHVQSSGGLSSFVSAIFGIIIGKTLSKKVIITFHYSNTESFLEKYPRIFKYVLANSNKMIFVSCNQLKIVVDKFKNMSEKVCKISNGYDSNIYYRKKYDHGLLRSNCGDKKILYNISNLLPGKGQIYLIDAIYQMNRKDIVCFIAGNGPCYNKLEERIHELKLSDSVYLLGWVTDEENSSYLNECDLFVFPSVRESFGIVLIEALACGKPCVATCNGGSEEILSSERLGFLVPVCNSKALADAISKVLDDTNDWDAEYISNYASKYNWNDVAQKHIELYYYSVL